MTKIDNQGQPSPQILDWLSGDHILSDWRLELESVRDAIARRRDDEAELEKEWNQMHKWSVSDDEGTSDVAHGFLIDIGEKIPHQKSTNDRNTAVELASFIESVCKFTFRIIGEKAIERNFASKVVAILIKNGIDAYCQNRLLPTMTVLFRYRNLVVHNSNVLTSHEFDKFKQFIEKEGCPSEWFTRGWADMNETLFMSPLFVDHCVQFAEDLAEGTQAFLIDHKREKLGLARIGGGFRHISYSDLPELKR